MTTNEPPGPDANLAPRVLGITGAMYLVCLVLYGGRIYTRIRPVYRLGWDDYTITLGFALALIEWAIFITATTHGAGRHNFYVAPSEQVKASYFLFVSSLFWSWAIIFIKISIACMLLRIKCTKPWVIFCYTMIAVQFLSSVASIVFELLQCRPLAAMWDPAVAAHAVCVKSESSYASAYTQTIIAILTDLIFGIVPLIFIRKMQRPMREKLVLAGLMGLGLFAAITSIVKCTLITRYGTMTDPLYTLMDLILWSILEIQIGLIAACVPCLKAPFEHVLGKMGWMSTVQRSTQNSGHLHYGYGTQRSQRKSVMKRDTTGLNGDTDAQSEESILCEDRYELKEVGAGRIVKTTEVRMEEEDGVIDGDVRSMSARWDAV